MSVIFGQILKELRKEKGETQQNLATIFNVSKVTISAWETNKQEPCIEDIKLLARHFSVTTDYLLGVVSDDGSRIDEELEYTTTSLKYRRNK